MTLQLVALAHLYGCLGFMAITLLMPGYGDNVRLIHEHPRYGKYSFTKKYLLTLVGLMFAAQIWFIVMPLTALGVVIKALTKDRG